jgi:hypothetical protein
MAADQKKLDLAKNYFLSNNFYAALELFKELDDVDIGELPPEWNWLAIEYPENKKMLKLFVTL